MNTQVEPWPLGTPCWAELISRDPQQASDFYCDALGWNQNTKIGPGSDAYEIFEEDDGELIAGLGRIPSGLGAASIWLTHLATPDADGTASAVQEHGGSVLRAPQDRAGLGRTAIVADPTGAVFGLCQFDQTTLAPTRLNDAGSLIRTELMSFDAVRAREFYAEVFGYQYSLSETVPNFTWVSTQASGDFTICGIGELAVSEAAGTSSYWLNYFAISDTDVAMLRTRRAGGNLQVDPYDANVGRIAILSDSHGAIFGVIGDHSSARLG